MSIGATNFLSPDQIECFWHQGYLVVENMLDEVDLKVLRESLKVLETWAQFNSHPDFQREVDSDADRIVLRKVQHIHRHGGVPWRALMTRKDTLDAMVDLIGSHICFHHSKVMMKLAHEGSAKPWHQDLAGGFVLPDEAKRLRALGPSLIPEAVPVVAIQYYLDDSSTRNGCIEVVPGSHRLGLFENPVNLKRMSTMDIHRAEVCAGGALLFHCLTFHYSAPNQSAQSRRAPVYEYCAPTSAVKLRLQELNAGDVLCFERQPSDSSA